MRVTYSVIFRQTSQAVCPETAKVTVMCVVMHGMKQVFTLDTWVKNIVKD